MGIHWNSGFAESGTHHHIGSLTPHTRQRSQVLHVIGHLAVILLDQFLCHLTQVCRLAVRIRYALDKFQNVFDTGSSHRLRSRVGLKQRGSNNIHALVGTLSAQHYSNQQLKWVVMLQLGLGVGLRLTEIVQDSLVSLLNRHIGLDKK